MTNELLTFQKFKDPDIARDIAEKLKQAGILYELDDDAKFFDASFAHDPMQQETRIKIRSSDFLKANQVLDDYYRMQVDQIGADHYLFAFSDTELMEILSKPDEWGRLDFQLAQKILHDRGYTIDNNTLETFREKRINELSKPEQSQILLIITGYISALLGGLFGLVVGWILTHSKRTLPDGSQAYTYNQGDRLHGRIISGISLLVIIVVLFLKVIPRF